MSEYLLMRFLLAMTNIPYLWSSTFSSGGGFGRLLGLMQSSGQRAPPHIADSGTPCHRTDFRSSTLLSGSRLVHP
ncbi:hypothetical protein BV20DRAFT_66789 [Pilatotrama ljubarskyi]|nr:hypothetical protein BV20DRAFT_66789 [Pilatotrama ljubarskyi]